MLLRQMRLSVMLHKCLQISYLGLPLQGLTEAHIFEEAQPIILSLKQQDCGPALNWCRANRAKLKKTKSKLEFKLRIQVWTLRSSS